MPVRFNRHPLAIAAAWALVSYLPSGGVMAGVGAGDGFDFNGNPVCVPSFFAHSPSGPRRTTSTCATELAAQLSVGPDTGAALRKFVDPLPLVGKDIPKAVPEIWTRPDGSKADGLDGKPLQQYYEIAVVEYTERLHSDLKRETLLRGYVQLASKAWRAANPGRGVPLFYPGVRDTATGRFAPGAPILIQDTDARGFLMTDASGAPVMVQAVAVAAPKYLGPVIFATQHVPVRVKFLNLLPAGRADAIQNGDGSWTVTARNGDIFLPTDKSIAGAGIGPDGLNEFTQNRVNIHLHGGDTPWISDGTPYQWITPVEEANAANPKSLVAAASGPTATLDPTFLPAFLRGASAANVPDMPDPGAGAMTYYFPNGQSARQMWYHDHTIGATRLNVYAGIVSGYVLTDAVEQALINGGTVNGTSLAKVLPADAETLQLVLQDRTFVPSDIALQDGRWHADGWGGESDSWFPHVYETVQDPNQENGFNAVGRWHYGPMFFPIFPALYSMPTGTYNDVTTTPEAWMDTAMVNGKAYPTLDVDPKTYRLRVLNASNDRLMTFNLFVADEANRAPFADPLTGQPSITEVSMVPAVTPPVTCGPGVTRYSQAVNAGGQPMVDAAGAPVMCTPDTWQMDARNGGVPNPATQGPTLYQIGNEGGWLPKVAAYDPSPMAYLIDKGRINVLNVDTQSLYLSPAERADLVVDFSQYAGKTLIVYSDSPSPVPAGDPRNDYFTATGDQSASGGAEDTLPGYGPSTRTMMRIRVAAAAPAAPLNVAALAAEIPKAYKASQEKPIVAQAAYNQALGTTYTDDQAYARIYTGTLKEPQFNYAPGTPDVFNSVLVSQAGVGFVSAPLVTFSGGGGRDAAALASLKLDKITVTNAGSGYTVAPIVRITSPVAGSGATASATLKVGAVSVTNGGAGYAGTTAAVTFSKPQLPGGITATGNATISAGRVTRINITNPGTGYAAVPTIAVTGGTTKAQLVVSGALDAITLTAPDPTTPSTAGGGGYTDLSANGLIISIGAPQQAGGVTATASATGKVFDVTLTNVGSGYTTPPTVTISGGGGTGAQAAVDTANGGAAMGRILVKPKAIHELFEPTFGRMNAILAVELPFTSALTQTTIPLANIDAPTELFGDGETQIWKITHNGVDTHPVHFHLLNVQLVNRVGWDGFIMPPLANEIGWKETIKMNPLEDVIVAVRAKRPPLDGFGVPNSVRPMDPSQPLGSPFGFTQVDPNSGVPKAVVNGLYNYNWEYVWHCHILGHEENDFMRPVVFRGNEVAPLAPTNLSYAGGLLRWTDNDVGVGTSRTAEIGFRAESRVGTSAFVPVAPVRAVNVGLNAAAGQIMTRDVNTLANATSIATPAITSFTVGNPVVTPGTVTGNSVPLNWTAVPDATGYRVLRNNVQIATLAVNVLTYTDSTVQPQTAYTYSVVATAPTTMDYRVSSVNSAGETSSTLSQPITGVDGRTDRAVTTPAGGPVAPVAPTNLVSLGVTTNTPRITLSWLDASTNETAFDVYRSTGAAAPILIGSVNTASTAGTGTARTFIDGTNNTATTTRPAVNTTYTYTVKSRAGTGAAAVSSALASNAVTVKVGTTASPFGATVPTALTGSATRVGATNNDLVTLNWTDETTHSNTTYQARVGVPALLGTTWTNFSFSPAAAPNSMAGSFTVGNNVRNRSVQVQMRAVNALGNGAWTPSITLTLP